MPVLGEILLVNTGDGLAPMIVSRVGEADFDGHAFLAGTQVMEITNATYGAGYGQCVPPTNPNSKEA